MLGFGKPNSNTKEVRALGCVRMAHAWDVPEHPLFEEWLSQLG